MPISKLQTILKRLLMSLLLAVLVVGCDDRASDIAREAADRQARQIELMAALQEKVADGSRQLVEADAQARREMVGVHHDLQDEPSRLDTGWSDLETQRQQITSQRRTESLLAPLLEAATVVALAVLVLGFCWYALVTAHGAEPSERELNELLLHDLLSDEPRLLPDQSSQASLPEPPRLEQPPDE